MNYWDKTCRGSAARITASQAAGVRNALINQNRQHLIATKVLYSAIWEPEDRGTKRAIGWAFNHFVPRFDTEIADGRHLVHMQAYDLGGGQVRWDAVWESGDRGTTRALGWAMADIGPRFNAEIAAGRHFTHLQAYDLGGGQIRWDAVWESGDRGTTWVAGWGMQDITTRFRSEIAAGRHLVHMQAYDLGGGQIRWDAVWEAGDRGTTFVLGSAFNDFVRQCEDETGRGRRLVHQQAYDVGGGRIGFDGVWENNPAGLMQTRILTESIYRFADRFNEETSHGRHVAHMQAVVGR